MSFELPSLPYSYSALEPYVGTRTLKVHHGTLQKNYVQKLNTLILGTPYDQLPLDHIVVEAPKDSPVYNNAAQVWNHTFLWYSMKPKGGGKPSRQSGFGRALAAYGNHEEFRRMFKLAVKDLFGSGYVWLAADQQGNILIWVGKNADNPMRYGYRPLLTLDLWEHAYFLDYQAKKLSYIDAFLDHVVNWNFAEANYKRAFGA